MSESTVRLHENNAGHLVISCGAVAYDVSPVVVQFDGHFAADAQALAEGDTSDWTVERCAVPSEDDWSLVATWDAANGVAVSGNIGVAARDYLCVRAPR